jgi:hypothetical protein
VYCRDCARFDLEAEKCLDGKVNPPSWETAVTVSQVLGLRSICMFNDHRERLVRARKPLDRAEQRKLWKD